jgi:tetraacyldisaccharide 4'-kinase
LTSAAEAGDEPFLLAQRLVGLAAVVSDANRVAAGKWAIENLRTDVFVLDDGFQHLAMARDLDIVTIDATNPWGGGRLLPAGRLREPRSGLARAHCLVLTRANQSNQLSDLTAALQRINSDHPEEFADLPHQMAAFCAVGNPESFFSLLREAGIEPIFTRSFQDHHQYTQSDLTSLIKEAEKAGAQGLITTAKDAVKLQPSDLRLPCYVTKIEISIAEEDEIKKLLDTVTS